MKHWLSGVMGGLRELDQEARETVLRECGKACAHSYTLGVFQDARRDHPDMDTFLSRLAVEFPGARYEQVDPRTLKVTYATCECDWVKLGLVKAPLLCGCSAHNLQENFEQSWGRPVSVTLASSILRGDPCCVFYVSFTGLK